MIPRFPGPEAPQPSALRAGATAFLGCPLIRDAMPDRQEHAVAADRDDDATPRLLVVAIATLSELRRESPFFPAEPRYFVYRRVGLR
jgi:hypothetical protein